MKNIVLYHHASCENHGCEAIVRTVAGIIDRQYPGSEYIVTSKLPDVDNKTVSDDPKIKFVPADKLNKRGFSCTV